MINDDERNASLIVNQKEEQKQEMGEDEEPADAMFDPASAPPSTGKLLRTFLKLSIPAILTNVLFWMCSVILVVYAGLMNDPIYVAVIGITWTCCALMVLSFLIGLNAA